MRNMKLMLAGGAMAALAVFSGSAQAATATANMAVQLIIQAGCEISTAPTSMDFGTHVSLLNDLSATSTFSVLCTNGQAYSIGISAGGGGNVTTRNMTGTDANTATVRYGLYKEASHTNNWGTDTSGTGNTGNGANQPYTVYGFVPKATTSPGSGTYTDTVAIIVTY